MFEVRGSSDKALLSEIGEVILDGIRQILEARADLAHGGAEEARREVELIAQEFIGMLCINVERRQNGLRESVSGSASRSRRSGRRSPPRERDDRFHRARKAKG